MDVYTFLREKKAAYLRHGNFISEPIHFQANAIHLQASWNGVICGGISAFVGAPMPASQYVPHPAYRDQCLSESGAELSGLWVREECLKSGLGLALMHAMVAELARRGVITMLGCGHTRVLELYAAAGLHRDTKFPGFTYPEPRYVTFCLKGSVQSPSIVDVDTRAAFLRIQESWQQARHAVYAVGEPILARLVAMPLESGRATQKDIRVQSCESPGSSQDREARR